MAIVDYCIADGIARIGLNRPERHNALVPELLDALREALRAARAAQPAAIVLHAAGPSFSTGGDVRAFYATPPAKRRAYADQVVGTLNATILDLLSAPCPTIAAVHARVTGGSVGLVLGCDIAVAGPKASFAPWYTAVGFSPDGAWTALMPERIGRARALEVQLLNQRIDSDEARRLGLVSPVGGPRCAYEDALERAARIRDARAGSIARTLALMRPDIHVVSRALEAERRHFLQQIETDEAEAGMAAFLGRRQESVGLKRSARARRENERKSSDF